MSAFVAILLAGAFAADGQWIVSSFDCDTAAARPILLQADGDAAPEWGVLEGRVLSVADFPSSAPPRRYTLPEATTLFDLRDTDRDGRAELAAIRSGKLEYWPEASLAAQSDAALSIARADLEAISFGGPKPYPLFVERRGEEFLIVPVGIAPTLWTLEGALVENEDSGAPALSELLQFNAWPSAPPGSKETPGLELHLHQVFASGSPPPGAHSPSPPPGTRRARDAEGAPAEDWPWFPLGDGARVLYALAAPDYRESLVRVEAAQAAAGDAPRSTPRRFPGIIIAPVDGSHDFDGDGLADLLLWRAPKPGASLDSLVRAAQDGAWDVVLTVHLFERARGRFAAQPIEWLRTQAPIARAIEGSVRGPFAVLRVEDLDGDGRAELLCTGAGNEISAWKFTGSRAAKPWVTARFREPILEIVMTARVPAYRWLGIARSAGGYHLLALPQD